MSSGDSDGSVENDAEVQRRRQREEVERNLSLSSSSGDESPSQPTRKRVAASPGSTESAPSHRSVSKHGDNGDDDSQANSDAEHGDARPRAHSSESDAEMREEPEGGDEAGQEVAEEQLPVERDSIHRPQLALAENADNCFLFKCPNFFSIETRPFDPDFYEVEEDEDQLDEEGRQRLKLKFENTIRWRYELDEEGREIRESNARLVKWSDGTMSLRLGNELFDVAVNSVEDNSQLFMKAGPVLAAEMQILKKLTFRPQSTESSTHKKVTLSMADKTTKSARVKVIANVDQNPEALKQAAIRQEEEKLRAVARREAAAARRARSYRDPHRAGGGGLSAAYLEMSDEESLNKIKRSYQRSANEPPLIGASDSSDASSSDDKSKHSDDDSDKEVMRARQAGARRKMVTEDDDDDDDDDSDGANAPPTTSKKPEVSDDSDSD